MLVCTTSHNASHTVDACLSSSFYSGKEIYTDASLEDAVHYKIIWIRTISTTCSLIGISITLATHSRWQFGLFLMFCSLIIKFFFHVWDSRYFKTVHPVNWFFDYGPHLILNIFLFISLWVMENLARKNFCFELNVVKRVSLLKRQISKIENTRQSALFFEH